ncbi:hypothetical protein BGZ60DRAFT_233703 [Tricladium varicosporioides]|nr:hypothetical protein BGZ60DRAFT_233703 [Hymenoscyphus varicosporioides]
MAPYIAIHCGLFDYQGDHLQRILQDWVGLAFSNRDFLETGIFLSACRNILSKNPGDPVLTRMALQYKQRSIRSLRQALNVSPGILSFAIAIALALDEQRFGELEIAQQHFQGVHVIVETNGGIQSLGLSELLERMYWRHAYNAFNVPIKDHTNTERRLMGQI